MARKASESKSPRKSGAKGGGEAGGAALDPLRAGMPAPDSITGVKRIERGGKVYRIIKTDEADEYDPPPAKGRGRKS